MMNNWTDQLANLRTGAKALAQANPPWSRPTPGSTGRWARARPWTPRPGAHRTGRRGDDPLRWLHCLACRGREAGRRQPAGGRRGAGHGHRIECGRGLCTRPARWRPTTSSSRRRPASALAARRGRAPRHNKETDMKAAILLLKLIGSLARPASRRWRRPRGRRTSPSGWWCPSPPAHRRRWAAAWPGSSPGTGPDHHRREQARRRQHAGHPRGRWRPAGWLRCCSARPPTSSTSISTRSPCTTCNAT